MNNTVSARRLELLKNIQKSEWNWDTLKSKSLSNKSALRTAVKAPIEDKTTSRLRKDQTEKQWKSKKIEEPIENPPIWHISFRGRTHRFAFLLALIIYSALSTWWVTVTKPDIWSISLAILAIIEIVISVWAISISVRRLHDLGMSAWWTLLVIPWMLRLWGHVPLTAGFLLLMASSVGSIVCLVLLFGKWNNGVNQYWPVSK